MSQMPHSFRIFSHGPVMETRSRRLLPAERYLLRLTSIPPKGFVDNAIASLHGLWSKPDLLCYFRSYLTL